MNNLLNKIKSHRLYVSTESAVVAWLLVVFVIVGYNYDESYKVAVKVNELTCPMQSNAFTGAFVGLYTQRLEQQALAMGTLQGYRIYYGIQLSKIMPCGELSQ